jgi:hypothetical protein
MSKEDKAFDTKEAVERLKNMDKHLPALVNNNFMRELCAYLAKRINSEPILPAGFVIAYLLVVDDAVKNRDGFTGEPMPHALTGQPPMLYSIVMRLQEPIARAAFGEEFGDLVRDMLKEVDEP